MTQINRSDSVQKPIQRQASAPAAAAEGPAKSPFDSDFFKRTAPTPEKIKEAKQAIADLAALPKVPFVNKGKAAWIEAAKTQIAAAEKGLDTLRDAAWEKQFPDEELDKARDAVSAAREKLASAEVRAGLKPLPKPLNPFRPLMQYTNGLGKAPNNLLGALITGIGLPVAIAVDIADMATRPLQAVAWPLGHVWNGVRKVGQMVGVG